VGVVGPILVGWVAGSVLGLLWMWARRHEAKSYELPFGTFLAAAGIVIAFRGEGWLKWYAELGQ